MTARAVPIVDERPLERGRTGPSRPTPLDAIVQRVIAFPRPDAPLTPLEIQRDRLAHLERLDDELAGFLAKSAPATWAEHRRALWRVLRAARRELRAAERALIAQTSGSRS